MTARKVFDVLKTPVTLLALLALVYFGAKWGWNEFQKPVPPRPPEPCVVKQVGPQLKPEHAIVRVFNATETNGVGRRAATVLRANGFHVIKIGNAEKPENGLRIVGFKKDSPEVVLVAGQFKNPTVVADGRADHSVDIYIGNGYTGFKEPPLASVAVKNGEACLPTLPSSGASG